MMRVYSAAWRVCLTNVSNALVARSMKPGLFGENARNTSRSMPSASASNRNFLRSVMNVFISSKPPKSDALTAQRHSSAVGVLASPSSLINGVFDLTPILHCLTFVGFSQGNDPHRTIPHRIYTHMQPVANVSIGQATLLSIVKSRIRNVHTALPFQQHYIAQRQPVLGAVLRILFFIPNNLHPAQPIPVRVNATLTRPTKRGVK
jgi:hypothetical protein